MSSVAEPLINYLRQLQSEGQTHVTIDDDVRPILREFFIRAKTGKATTPPASQASQVSATKSEPAVQVPTLAAAAKELEVPQEIPTKVIAEGGSKDQKIASLKKQAESCAEAKTLGTLRQTMVFSTGNTNADVMLVGEAPGFDEERLKEPFVGKAGQKLDGILAAMGIDRKQTYISNIVKFRPAMENQTTNNRKPTPAEMAAFLPFVHQEIEIVGPKVIIALWGTAAQALLECTDPVAKMRGEFHCFGSIPVRVTYHPSYILHNEATSEKRKLWEDMLAVMGLLEMPISDKQQSFFLPKA